MIVATGPSLRERVLADGFEHVELRLGAGHNDGVNGAGEDPRTRTPSCARSCRRRAAAWWPRSRTRSPPGSTTCCGDRARPPPTAHDLRRGSPGADRRRPARLRGHPRPPRARSAVRVVPAEPSLSASAPRSARRLPGPISERADAARARARPTAGALRAADAALHRRLQRRAHGPEPGSRTGGRGRLDGLPAADGGRLPGRTRARRRAPRSDARRTGRARGAGRRRPARSARRAPPGHADGLREPGHVPVRPRGRAGPHPRRSTPARCQCGHQHGDRRSHPIGPVPRALARSAEPAAGRGPGRLRRRRLPRRQQHGHGGAQPRPAGAGGADVLGPVRRRRGPAPRRRRRCVRTQRRPARRDRPPDRVAADRADERACPVTWPRLRDSPARRGPGR